MELIKFLLLIITTTLLVIFLSMTTPQDISDMVTQCSHDMAINQELICD